MSTLKTPPPTVAAPSADSPPSCAPLLFASSDRKTVVSGKSVDLGVRRIIKKKKLSVLFEPRSSAAARQRTVGEVGAVLAFMLSLVREFALALPARSVWKART